jgi:hypothetical protein
VTVSEEAATPALAREFEVLRGAADLEVERRQLDAWLTASPDKILALVAEMDDLGSPEMGAGTLVYARRGQRRATGS